MGSTSSRAQGSCAEFTSPARSTVTSSPSSARLSSKMQRLHLLCLGLLVLGCILNGKREPLRLPFLWKGEDAVFCSPLRFQQAFRWIHGWGSVTALPSPLLVVPEELCPAQSPGRSLQGTGARKLRLGKAVEQSCLQVPYPSLCTLGWDRLGPILPSTPGDHPWLPLAWGSLGASGRAGSGREGVR